MAQFDDDAPPGYRYVYFGDPSQGTSGRYPVPIDKPVAEPSRDLVGTSAAPSLPTTAPELQPEPSRDIVPHRYVAGEVPGGPAPEPTLDQMRYELARKNLTPADWLMGGAENVASLLTGLPGMLGGYAGLAYHGLRGAPFKEADEKAADWARATSYQPTTLAGQEIAEDYVHPFLAKLPPVISGIMPGLMRAPKGTTSALTAGVKRDVGQFSNDVFNAQRGITPGYPTMGSEFQKAFVEPRPNVYEMLTGIEPSNVPSTASAAVKTKGGNFPLSFGNDLEVSGQIGRHLNRKLSDIPLDENRIPNLAKRDPVVKEKWQNFIDSKDISYAQALYWRNNKEYQGRYKELVSEFIDKYKDELPQLTTLTDTEKLLQAQNSFIQNQYARYLTNEMGTGAKTDTLVRLAEQGIAVPEIAEVFDANYPGRAADLEGPWVLPAVKNLLTANKLKGIEAVQQTATTPFGKYIESLADEGVTPTSKKLYEDLLTLQKKLGLPTKYADTPTPFERIPEDMPIWDLPELWSNTELGLDRILEKLNTDLKSGAIKPENVKNVSIESLVRGLMDENLKKLAAEKKLLLENLKATPRFNVPEPAQLLFVKSPGMTWIDIPETTDAKGLKLCTTLGKQAGWCTQDANIAKPYGSGENRLTTLVDAEGRPHAQAKISEVPYPPKWDEAKLYLDAARKKAKALPNGYTEADVSNIAVQMAKDARPKNITELKPPENSFTSERSKTYSRRDPEYKAKVTDSVLKFLNAEEWGDVKDLSLYDILDTRNSLNLTQEILKSNPNLFSAQPAVESIRANFPRFITKSDLDKILNPDHYAEGGAVRMAEGGIVHMADGGQASKEDEAAPFADNIDQMRYELTKKNSGPVWDETGKQIDPNTGKPIQAPFQFDMTNRSAILPMKYRADADWQKSVMAKPEEKGWDWALPGMLASPINALSRGIHNPNVIDANEVAMTMMGGSLGLSRARPVPAGSSGAVTKISHSPEYYHGSDVKGLTVLDPAAGVGRRSEGSSVWITPDETFAAGYPKTQTGSIYTTPLDTLGFAKVDANFTSNKAISPNAMIYHSNGEITPVSSLGQKVTTDQLAAYARSKGDPGLRIMNVGDMGSGQFAGMGPNPSMHGESIAVFSPLKVSGERNVSDVAKQYATAENTKPLTVYRGGNQDLNALTKKYNGVFYTTEPRTASQYGEVKQHELPNNLKTFKLWSNEIDKNFIHDETTLRSILKDLGKNTSDLTTAATGMFISPPKNLGEVLKKYGYDSMQAHDMLFVPVAKTEKPLTEKQFHSRYSQHVDIRNRENQQGAETLKSIQESGWKPGFSVNTLPPYRGGTPTNVVDKKLAPRTGDYVYLVPNTFTTKTGNGLKINEGWTPKPYEAVRVTEDYPDMYKEYLKAFNAKAEGGVIHKADGGIIHMAEGGQPKPLSYMENKSAPFGEYRRGIGMKKGTLNKFEGGAVTDTLDKMVKNPQASTLLNLDLPNIVAAKQQAQPLKRGGTVKFSNNIDDMRYALTRRQG